MPKLLIKVDHGVLLNKLKNFGICGKLGEWLHSFLTNRRQHVRIPGGVSEGDNVLSGVPQGTVLGPVLFLVLISDISSNVSSNITSFADDTKVFATIFPIFPMLILWEQFSSQSPLTPTL